MQRYRQQLGRMKLKVNEIFDTFQGEGSNIGMPCTFLRLSICNLHCKWCDTAYTWNFGKGDGVEERFGSKTYKMSEEVKDLETREVAKILKEHNVQNLVISGGEPMLQQAALIEMFEHMRDHLAFFPKHIEIETNGTIPLWKNFDAWIAQINCSPKLASSGNDLKARYRPEVLRAYRDTGKACFKFVVTSEEDLQEIIDIIEMVGIPQDMVYLMPQGKTKEEQETFQAKVAEIATANGFNFSPRLHVLLYGNKRGV